MKKCTKCGESKDESCFCKRLKSHDGLALVCRQCASEWHRNYYNANTSEINEHNRNYYKANAAKTNEHNRNYQKDNAAKISELKRKYYAEHREQIAEVRRKYRKENSEKTKAMDIANQAIRKGILKRSNICSKCGVCSGIMDAHHPDYLRQLDVVWLCRSCHQKLHVKMRKANEER